MADGRTKTPRRVVSISVNAWDGRLAITNIPGRLFFCPICDARRRIHV